MDDLLRDSTEENDDDMFDSEDQEYPVNYIKHDIDSWHIYNEKTKEMVHSAMEKKASEIDRAFSLIGNCVPSSHYSRSDDMFLEKHLQKMTMEQEEIDFKESVLFENRNKEMIKNIEKAIQKADEEEKKKIFKDIEIKQKMMSLKAEKNTKVIEEVKFKEKKIDTITTVNNIHPLIPEEKKVLEQKKEYTYNAIDRVLMYKKRIEDIKLNVLKPVMENVAWRTFCFQNKRRIIPKCGQLTNSKQQITRITKDLEEIIQASKEIATTVYYWILNFLSKAIIKQAETEVTVNLYSAYPLAMVSVFLMSNHPDLVDILLARFAKKCPYTIPYLNYNKNTEEGKKALGFYRLKNGNYEEETSYTERQCGIFAVFSAIMQTQYVPNYLPICFGWTLLAKLLNESPSSETVFAIISTFIDVAGNAFMKHYGLQADKLIRLAVNEWLGDNKGSCATRLKILGEEWITQRKIGLNKGGHFEE